MSCEINDELSNIINLLEFKDDILTNDPIISLKFQKTKKKKKKEFSIHTYLNDNIDPFISKNINETYKEPTPLKISTITAIAIIGSDIDLGIISKFMSINNNIRYIEYANDTKRGTPTKKISKKKSLKKKIFFNQATVVVNISEDKYVNTKIFTNGKIQMTGLKNIDDGKIVINTLISCCEFISNS